MIDEMVEVLKKDQLLDDEKKEYCDEQFDITEDKKKELDLDIADADKAIDETKESIATVTEELAALEESIKALDKSVAVATFQRKDEHADFQNLRAANNGAKELILFAKNRMQKFYNPKLYKPPPKRELTEEERITLNMGGTLAPTDPPGGIAGTGVSFAQVRTTTSLKDVLPPPPEASFVAKKSEESGGVLAMMDMMIADVKKEIQEMEFEEKDAQEEYEIMVNEAAEKRGTDTKSVEEKTSVKAGLEDEIVKNGDQKAAEEDELMATKQYISDLHADCDWLIQNFDTRKEARTNEIDALKKAKAVLSGADFSLLQVERLRHRV
jgi:chromosome segregation ATPase